MNEFRIIFPDSRLPESVHVNGEEYVRRFAQPPAPKAAPPLELGDFVRVGREGTEGPRIGQLGCVTEAAPTRISVTFDGPFKVAHICPVAGVAHAKHGRWFWVHNEEWTDGIGTRIEKI